MLIDLNSCNLQNTEAILMKVEEIGRGYLLDKIKDKSILILLPN